MLKYLKHHKGVLTFFPHSVTHFSSSIVTFASLLVTFVMKHTVAPLARFIGVEIDTSAGQLIETQ